MVVYSGRTVEQAIEKGLKDLNLPRMKAHIKVISREKKGFLGFGKKPARVSVEPINEKIAHEADQNTVKVAPDAIKQLDDSVASPKDETIAFNKVTKLVAVSDNKEIAHEDLKQPVSTETLDEELPDKKQEQPKATIIPLSVKRELSEEGATESMANSLEPQLEPVTQVQTSETSESAAVTMRFRCLLTARKKRQLRGRCLRSHRISTLLRLHCGTEKLKKVLSPETAENVLLKFL